MEVVILWPTFHAGTQSLVSKKGRFRVIPRWPHTHKNTHVPPECVDCINCCHMIICLSAFQKSYLLVCCVGDCFLKWYMHSYAHVLQVMCICEHSMQYKHIPGGLSVHMNSEANLHFFHISVNLCFCMSRLDCTFNPQNSCGDREMACLCVCACC